MRIEGNPEKGQKRDLSDPVNLKQIYFTPEKDTKLEAFTIVKLKYFRFLWTEKNVNTKSNKNRKTFQTFKKFKIYRNLSYDKIRKNKNRKIIFQINTFNNKNRDIKIQLFFF